MKLYLIDYTNFAVVPREDNEHHKNNKIVYWLNSEMYHFHKAHRWLLGWKPLEFRKI